MKFKLSQFAKKFQNFSSLQFILINARTHIENLHFKTFQVYSSLNKDDKEVKQVQLFQNFSSLQFILVDKT